MSFLEQNLKAIAGAAPAFYHRVLEGISPSPAMEIVDTPGGFPSARIEGRWVHSPRDPRRESRKITARALPDNCAAVILLGFGLGYNAEALLARNPDTPLVVVEPDAPLFLQALAVRDLRETLNHPALNLFIGTDLEELIQLLKDLPEGEFPLYRTRGIYDGNPVFFRQVEERLALFREQRQINRNTLKKFGAVWVRNILRNIPAILKSSPAAAWESRLNQVPALLLAAGPSLDDIIPLLPELRRRFCLVAVDSAVSALADQGVSPHFVVTVDPQYLNSRHLDRLPELRTRLLAQTSTHPAAFRRTAIPLIFCESLFPVGQLLEAYTPVRGRLGAGGSVATTAWDFCRYLGCSPIYCAGLDLGYPDSRTHARSSLAQHFFQRTSRRLTPLETLNYRQTADAGPFREKNNSGGETWSDKRLNLYRTWFAAQMKKYPETITYNLSPQGIRIEGMPTAEATALLQFPPLKPEARELLDAGSSPESPPSLSDVASLVKALEDLQGDAQELERLSSRARELTMTALGRLKYGHAPDREFQQLDAIDQAISGFGSRELFGFLTQESVNAILNTPAAGHSREELLHRSEELYRGLEYSAAYHRTVITETLARIAGRGKPLGVPENVQN